MTKTVEEVRRAAFEVAYLKQFGRYPDNWCNVISKYLNAHAQGAWWAWQAALNAVEIELPELAEGFADHVNEHAQTVFLDAIEQAGLGLRVK
jgi:hypothetical protein